MDVCCVQEVRYKGGGATTIGSGEEKFKFWCSGRMEGGGCVGVLVRHERAGSVVKVERFSHRVMKVKIVIEKVIYQFFRYMLLRWGGRMRRRASSGRSLRMRLMGSQAGGCDCGRGHEWSHWCHEG